MAMHDCSIELHIDYDNEGITSRRVSVFGYEWNEKETAVVIHGFCHLREPLKNPLKSVKFSN
jgi:hypothetical protein